MQKKTYIIWCATLNVLFIFAQIYKHTHIVELTYTHQKHDASIARKTQTVQELTQQLCALKSRDEVKQFAQHKLNMQPLALKQVKRLPVS